MYHLILEDLAVIEMQEAFEWYESQEAGLGFDLIEKAEACFASITTMPQYYYNISDKERRIHLDKYPYKIIYFIKEDTIVVTSFFLASREPLY
jgi:toxin ParE1/3/4